jgi:hypothetical protein
MLFLAYLLLHSFNTRILAYAAHLSSHCVHPVVAVYQNLRSV